MGSLRPERRRRLDPLAGRAPLTGRRCRFRRRAL